MRPCYVIALPHNYREPLYEDEPRYLEADEGEKPD